MKRKWTTPKHQLINNILADLAEQELEDIREFDYLQGIVGNLLSDYELIDMDAMDHEDDTDEIHCCHCSRCCPDGICKIWASSAKEDAADLHSVTFT